MTTKIQGVVASPDKKEAPAGTGAVQQILKDNISSSLPDVKTKAEFDQIDFIKRITGVHDGDGLYIGIGRKKGDRLIRENGTLQEFGSLMPNTSIMDGNFWFCTSALKSEDGQRRDNCAATKGIIVDLDYGSIGHKKPSYFATEEEALECLRKLPVKPSIVWNTGHGLQAAFFLKEAVFYSDKDRCAEFEKAKAYIYSATHSDSTQSLEHLFRVPGSMNVKPSCPPVRTRIIDDMTGFEAYTPAEIISQLEPLFPNGLPVKVHSQSASNVTFTTDWHEHEGDVDSLDDINLPCCLQELLTTQTVDDASAQFFKLCIELFERGCTLACIVAILEDVAWVPERYMGRIETEVERCLTKYDPEKRFAVMESAEHIGSDSKIIDIPLEETEELPDEYLAMLDRYCNSIGITPDEKMLRCCQFQEQIYNSEGPAQIALGCGRAKTTHAIVHVALNAGPNNKFVIVVQNRGTIFGLSKSLEGLGIAVGIYIGFNPGECHKLTKKEYTYDQCLRGHKDSKCRECDKTEQCPFHQSNFAFEKDVVLITHESFIIQTEKGRDFSDYTVIIDEELKLFSTEKFKAPELARLKSLLQNSNFPEIRNLISDIFPDLQLKSTIRIRKTHSIESDGMVRYICLNDIITSDILRTLFRFSFSKACSERYHKLFFRFLLFIRTAAQCGSAIAYTVTKDNTLLLKKQRIDFRSFCKFKQLFILNASAHLSVVSFPDTMPTVTCSDLDAYSYETVRLHIVIGSPTKSRIPKNMEAGLELFNQYAEEADDSDKLLLSFNPDRSEHFDKVSKSLAKFITVYTSSSGNLRSTNNFKNCSAAFFASTGFFTSLSDCALTICLTEQQDISWERFMKAGGTPRMDSNGRFCDPAMQETYAKTCLDLMYQAIYRTAARCGKDVDIILPIPSIDWLIALHNLMPCEVVAVKGSNKRREATFTGISTLINMSEGETISKQDVASACGYASWKQAKRILKDVMTELFEFTTRTLTRKSGEVHRQ